MTKSFSASWMHITRIVENSCLDPFVQSAIVIHNSSFMMDGRMLFLSLHVDLRIVSMLYFLLTIGMSISTSCLVLLEYDPRLYKPLHIHVC